VAGVAGGGHLHPAKIQAHWLQPFDKVYERITTGSDDLWLYFSEFIPRLLASE
jgi:hypothetical protein